MTIDDSKSSNLSEKELRKLIIEAESKNVNNKY